MGLERRPIRPPPRAAGPGRPAIQRPTSRGLKSDGNTHRANALRPSDARKSQTPLIIGGVGGGVLLLIIIAVASSGSDESRTKRRSGDSETKAAKRPVDVSGLEKEGMKRCQEGYEAIVKCEPLLKAGNASGADKSQLKFNLQRGKDLLTQGMNMLSEANDKTSGEHKYDLSQYQQALMIARKKLLEME